MKIAAWLIRRDDRRIISLRSHIAHPFPKTTPTELFGAAEEIDRIVCVVGRDAGFHGAEMLVTKREDVRPHVCGECSIRRPPERSHICHPDRSGGTLCSCPIRTLLSEAAHTDARLMALTSRYRRGVATFPGLFCARFSHQSLPQLPSQNLSRRRPGHGLHKVHLAGLLVVRKPIGHKPAQGPLHRLI
jgi:hypothetical protein